MCKWRRLVFSDDGKISSDDMKETKLQTCKLSCVSGIPFLFSL